uniref:Uncharacterized protein n=1 Tax=Glossina palpalis gambiensis TaxID=67801 RepID=A0A1B0BUW3_9MUSC
MKLDNLRVYHNFELIMFVPATRLAHSSAYRSAAVVSADAVSPTILMLCNDCLTLNLLNQPSDA